MSAPLGSEDALPHGRILIVDDEEDMCDMLEATLSVRGYEVTTRTSAEAALALLEEQEFDVLVADVNLGPGRLSGLELCERLKAQRPELLTVVMTAFGSMETAVSALRVGAHDFITKPIENELFRLLIERAVRHRHLRSEVRRLRRAVESTRSYEEILGGSPAMGSLFRLIERVAKSAASVLITGESGTGKELVARAIHARSGRGEAPFVAVNCAAMPEPLLESELFGHAKGAFTDARAARGGLFVKAQGGTLFLDEIGELPITLQPKILRALQERAVRPVGSDQEIPIDVRFIAATNRDLETEVEERRFREDLYFRINVIHVELPPLRSRGGDVLLLAQHFVAHHAAVSQKPVRGISSEAASRLQQYPWPGNVRELQNCMERAVALTEYDEITVEDLPERVRKHRSSHVVVASNDPSELVSLEEVERRYILKVLDAVGGNKTMAGKILGLDRKTLYRKMERWGIEGKI
jgi:two-component system response regulator AtoC